MLAPSLVVSDGSPALKSLWIDPSRNSVLSYQLVQLWRLDINLVVLSIEVKIAWSIHVIHVSLSNLVIDAIDLTGSFG
jgi:hypothetical protein